MIAFKDNLNINGGDQKGHKDCDYYFKATGKFQLLKNTFQKNEEKRIDYLIHMIHTTKEFFLSLEQNDCTNTSKFDLLNERFYAFKDSKSMPSTNKFELLNERFYGNEDTTRSPVTCIADSEPKHKELKKLSAKLVKNMLRVSTITLAFKMFGLKKSTTLNRDNLQ